MVRFCNLCENCLRKDLELHGEPEAYCERSNIDSFITVELVVGH